MRVHLEDDEHIALTLFEIQILVALTFTPNSSRGVGHVISHHTGLTARISQGALTAALHRLQNATLITTSEVTPPPGYGRTFSLYRLSDTGRLILNWRLNDLEKLIEAGRKNLRSF
jgi:DNA-binding PadR family transcriptional regulator